MPKIHSDRSPGRYRSGRSQITFGAYLVFTICTLHAQSYLPLSGGTMTGSIASSSSSTTLGTSSLPWCGEWLTSSGTWTTSDAALHITLGTPASWYTDFVTAFDAAFGNALGIDNSGIQTFYIVPSSTQPGGGGIHSMAVNLSSGYNMASGIFTSAMGTSSSGAWGIVTLATDGDSLNGTYQYSSGALTGIESDIENHNSSNISTAFLAYGGSSATGKYLGVLGWGARWRESVFAYDRLYHHYVPWNYGFESRARETPSSGLYLDAQGPCTLNNSNTCVSAVSQPIVFVARDASAAAVQSVIYGDTNGNVEFWMPGSLLVNGSPGASFTATFSGGFTVGGNTYHNINYADGLVTGYKLNRKNSYDNTNPSFDCAGPLVFAAALYKQGRGS